jgi:hypothetical protein
MADVVEKHDLTAPSQDGWALDYRIRREDGEELHAEVRCWNKAHAAAERAGNAEALGAIADGGSAAALELRGGGGVPGDARRGPDLDLVRPDERRQSASSGQLRARSRVGHSGELDYEGKLLHRAPASCSKPVLEILLDSRPFVVDDRVPGGVAEACAVVADEHVLAEHAFELRGQCGEGAT